MNICLFGDSVTWGAWLNNRVAWADLLRTYLEQQFGRKYSVYNLGIDGNTTRELLSRFDIEANHRNPGIIIFSVGINDSCYRQSTNSALVEITEFKRNLDLLIKKALSFKSKILLVGLVKGDDSITVPFPGSTTGKCYTKQRAQLYDQTIKQLADDHNLIFISLWNQLTDEDFLDGLHPNEIGHQKIFQIICQALESDL